MSIIRKVVPMQVTDVEGNPNRSRFVAATNQLARDGHVLEPKGMSIENFLRSGTILFDHDPATPVGSPAAASLNADGNLEVEVEWAPTGISADADKIRGLVTAGVLRAGSVGFDPLDAEGRDGGPFCARATRRRRGPLHGILAAGRPVRCNPGIFSHV